MRIVAIGDEEEYTARLVRFLEGTLPEYIHIVSYTNPESFIRDIDTYTCYVTGEDFWMECLEILDAEGRKVPEENDGFRHIIICDREREGGFYRYHSPARLADMIEKCLGQTKGEIRRREQDRHRLIAVYTPVYDKDMLKIAAHIMEEDALYFGMEDIGDELNEKGDMSDVCYYIRLRDEEIFDRIRDLRRFENRRFFIDSPLLYYDFAELSKEDYQWFFQQYADCDDYSALYFGMGNGAVHSPEIFQHFDQVIILDSRNNEKQHSFCQRLSQIMESGISTPKYGFCIKYREDILYECIQ